MESNIGRESLLSPEHKEERHKMRFEQLRYGKIVEQEGGPIVNGSGHDVTGWTRDLPRELPYFDMGIGRGDLDMWEEYPWVRNGGGIVKKTVRTDKGSYVICVRENGRPESGKDGLGRYYTEKRYWVIPEEQWSVAAVAQLAENLKAEPAVLRKELMKPVEINDAVLDEPLPPDWFDKTVESMLFSIISGRPLNVTLERKDRRPLTIKTHLQKFFYTMICSPEDAAKKIDFGSGLFVNWPGRRDKVKVGFKVGGFPIKEKRLDTETAKAYLDEVKKVIEDCKTPREVMRAIARIPREILDKVNKNINSLA